MNQVFEIHPLSWLIEDRGKKEVQKYLKSFKPYKDSDAGRFLLEKAIMMGNRDLSRTYLAINPIDDEILGFVTLGVKCLAIPKENLLPKGMLEDMFIDSKTGVVQAFLLAQLVRSENSPRGFGKELINLAMDVLINAKSLVGCRIVRIDCEDELVSYYIEKGFTLVRPNEEGTLNQMLTFMSPLSLS
jgi:hypothetical protein